jgi:hypothetical protein
MFFFFVMANWKKFLLYLIFKKNKVDALDRQCRFCTLIDCFPSMTDSPPSVKQDRRSFLLLLANLPSLCCPEFQFTDYQCNQGTVSRCFVTSPLDSSVKIVIRPETRKYNLHKSSCWEKRRYEEKSLSLWYKMPFVYHRRTPFFFDLLCSSYSLKEKLILYNRKNVISLPILFLALKTVVRS